MKFDNEGSSNNTDPSAETDLYFSVFGDTDLTKWTFYQYSFSQLLRHLPMFQPFSIEKALFSQNDQFFRENQKTFTSFAQLLKI